MSIKLLLILSKQQHGVKNEMSFVGRGFTNNCWPKGHVPAFPGLVKLKISEFQSSVKSELNGQVGHWIPEGDAEKEKGFYFKSSFEMLASSKF